MFWCIHFCTVFFFFFGILTYMQLTKSTCIWVFDGYWGMTQRLAECSNLSSTSYFKSFGGSLLTRGGPSPFFLWACVKGLNLNAEQCLGIRAASSSEYSSRGILLPHICLGQSIFCTSPTPTTSPLSSVSFWPSLGHPGMIQNLTWHKLVEFLLERRTPFHTSPLTSSWSPQALRGPPAPWEMCLICDVVCCNWERHTRFGRLSIKNKNSR